MDELFEDEACVLKRLEDIEKENKNSADRLWSVQWDAFKVKQGLEESLKRLNNEND